MIGDKLSLNPGNQTADGGQHCSDRCDAGYAPENGEYACHRGVVRWCFERLGYGIDQELRQEEHHQWKEPLNHTHDETGNGETWTALPHDGKCPVNRREEGAYALRANFICSGTRSLIAEVCSDPLLGREETKTSQ